MGSLILGLILSVAVLTTAFDAPVNYCLPGPVKAEKDLSSSMKMPENYKARGTLTDWIGGKSSYFTETSVKGTKALSMSSKNSETRIVQLEKEHFSVNRTHCLPVKEQDPYSIGVTVQTYLNATDASSLSAIIDTILAYSHTNKGSLNDTVIVAGTEGVRWFNCINSTATNKTLQIEVVFTDTGSLPLPEFNNPQMMFIRLSEFAPGPNGTSTFTSSISLSIDQRTDAQSGASAFDIPDGVICEGRSSTPLAETFADPVNLVIQNDTVTYELHYSPKNQLAVVQSGKIYKDKPVPFFELAAAEDAETFVHDYLLGYEYSLDSSACQAIRPIGSSSAESKVEGERISLKLLDEILGNKSLPWQEYNQAEAVPVYRARGTNGDVLQLRKNGNSVEIRTYANGVLKGNWTYHVLSSTSTPQIIPLVRDCFAKQTGADSSYMFTVKDMTVKDVVEIGEEVVTSGLADKFAEFGLGNKFRVKAAYSGDPSGRLNVLVRIADKFNHEPTPTSSNYNRTAELGTNEFFSKLNQTMKGQDWPFKVAGKDWLAAKSSLTRYPPPPPPPTPAPFQGYTGGAMFVLGLFSIVFGAAIGAGALFFISRRQRISTLAYQVFE